MKNCLILEWKYFPFIVVKHVLSSLLIERSTGDFMCSFSLYRVISFNLDPKQTQEDCALKEESSTPDKEQLVATEVDVGGSTSDSWKKKIVQSFWNVTNLLTEKYFYNILKLYWLYQFSFLIIIIPCYLNLAYFLSYLLRFRSFNHCWLV